MPSTKINPQTQHPYGKPDSTIRNEIPVTRPFLPPREEYEAVLAGIWERNWLTNNGPLVQQLEADLKQFLELEHLLYVSNGTIALQLAIKALQLKGEVITTPFSYVATTSSIVWENCTPVFVDIEPERLTLDPAKIEAAITPRTTGILATHVYGLPCFVDEIEAIAKRHQLKVIYDAAHAFGTRYKNRSLYDYGDISTASFHATKLFHTTEGGAVISRDEALIAALNHHRNFGHAGPEKFANVGINGKNSEFHAAMGLVNLRYVDAIMETRKHQGEMYRQLLIDSPVKLLAIPDQTEYNYAYMPVIFPTEQELLKAVDRMHAAGIFPRRYFYPALHRLHYVQSVALEVAEAVAPRVLCLPVYWEMKEEEIKKVVELIWNE